MERIDLASEAWWRFDRYEVRDGYVRPVAGAEHELFTSWEAYRNQPVPPYLRFLELMHSLEFQATSDGAGLISVTPTSEAQIADWCAQFGLFGSLQQRASYIELAPRWERLGPRGASSSLLQAQVRHIRGPDGWRSRVFQSLEGKRLRDQPHLEGALVQQDDPDSNVEEGRILSLVNLTDDVPTMMSLGEGCSPYFPDVPPEERNSHPYPRPDTDEFWRQYAEPLHRFVADAVVTEMAIKFIAGLDDGEDASPTGADAARALMSAVRPMLGRSVSGKATLIWRSSSLMASLVMMAIQDTVTGDRHLFWCAVCGRPTSSAKATAQYCSVKCRNTAQKRAYRARADPGQRSLEQK